ncbi:MAG TPA: hypothetical protein VEY71_01275 [Chitinophagales bacterium]|nr:hypothetical protein [Chitinophagales bacterium]
MRFHQPVLHFQRSIVLLLSFVALLFAGSFPLNAQDREFGDVEQPKRPLKDRIFTGGGVVFNIGGGTIGTPPNTARYTSLVVGASPIVGYKLTEKLAAGVGATYVYYRMKSQGDVYTTNIYGGNVFGRYLVWKDQIFAHAEYGFVNWEVPTYDINLQTYRNTRRNVPYLNLGGGLRQPIARNSYLEIFVLYDVLHNEYSYNPIPLSYRAGVNIGF